MSTAVRRYYYGHRLVSMCNVAEARKSTYHFDQQGTTQALTDSNAAVTDRFQCDAWGASSQQLGTSINRQWYIGSAGYQRDICTNLGYVRARYLAFRLGIWISRDPLGMNEDQPYAYAMQQPTRHIDPSGLEVKECRNPCDIDDKGKKVYPPNSTPPCSQMKLQYQDILAWCDADKNNKGINMNQSFVGCCYRKTCCPCRLVQLGCMDVVGDGKECRLYTGCIRQDNSVKIPWNRLPAAYQTCIWDHEMRRKVVCAFTWGSSNGEDPSSAETDRLLDCVMKQLQRCALPVGTCTPVRPVAPFSPPNY